jgi:hypothetical protein
MANVDGDELLLAMPVANYWNDPALPNPGLATPAALAMKISGLIVPSRIVFPPLTIIWDDTKHIEKRVEMGVEYWKCKWCGLNKKHCNAVKALAHVCKEFGNTSMIQFIPLPFRWYTSSGITILVIASKRGSFRSQMLLPSLLWLLPTTERH